MPRRSGISGGTVVVIAMVTSIVTSIATFFVVREWTASGATTVQSTPAATADAPYFPPNTEPKEPVPEPKPPPEAAADAKTPPQVVMPVLEGIKVDQALMTLMKLHLRVKSTERQENHKIGKGRVIASDPAAGTLVTADTQVALVVSKGSPDVEVPSVAGQRLSSARRDLDKAGLRAQIRYLYDEDFAEGVVLDQSPRRGTRVAPGSSVRLRVNRSDY